MSSNKIQSNSTFLHSHFASAIVWWLNYLTAVGRDYVISENTLKIPASEYLERFYRDNVFLEDIHPKLSPRRIDITFKDIVNGCQNAIELKFIKEDSTRALSERKRIFNDLMRMRLFISKDSKAYFIITGKQMEFTTSFKNLNLNPTFDTILAKKGYNSFYSKWFSFDRANPVKEILFNSLIGDYKKCYDDFFSDYEKNFEKTEFQNAKKIRSFKTNLVFLSEDISHPDIPQNFQIGIWEILE